MEWLRARETQPRCGILLQQICEWGGKNQAAMRALAVAQGINVSRRSRGTSKLLLEEVRKHFRAAISQEKGRLATFDFHIARGASEHLVPAAAEAEQWIQAADVIDLATLKRYRRQYQDLPSGVKEAVLSLGGGIALKRQRLKAIATALGVRMQHVVQYPGVEKAVRRPRLRHRGCTCYKPC